jgi:hypothetical protein
VRREKGFGFIDILIIIVICALILTFAIVALLGSKRESEITVFQKIYSVDLAPNVVLFRIEDENVQKIVQGVVTEKLRYLWGEYSDLRIEKDKIMDMAPGESREMIREAGITERYK